MEILTFVITTYGPFLFIGAVLGFIICSLFCWAYIKDDKDKTLDIMSELFVNRMNAAMIKSHITPEQMDEISRLFMSMTYEQVMETIKKEIEHTPKQKEV